ncbi:MAG: segregation/condensation protein A [Polyangiaceae bacterium]
MLLHLIQQHELDILDIPVSFITRKYLEYLALMRTLSIDVASEYLVMAATLTHIKSKMLLPSVPAGQEDDALAAAEEDPRAELVRRLLEYQKYKAAAAELGGRSALGRDVFARGSAEVVPEGLAPFAPTPLFSLLDAFNRVLSRAKVRIDHEVVFDRISITDRILQLTEKLGARKAMAFEELFEIPVDPSAAPGERRAPSRFDLVITFLAVLEMARMKILRVYQSDPLAPIHVELAVQDGKPLAGGDFGDPEPAESAVDEAPVDPNSDAALADERAADDDAATRELSPDTEGEVEADGDDAETLQPPAPTGPRSPAGASEAGDEGDNAETLQPPAPEADEGDDGGPAARNEVAPAADPANDSELPGRGDGGRGPGRPRAPPGRGRPKPRPTSPRPPTPPRSRPARARASTRAKATAKARARARARSVRGGAAPGLARCAGPRPGPVRRACASSPGSGCAALPR